MASQRGRKRAGSPPPTDEPVSPLVLSQDERRVLELHDQVRELEIKIALLKAQKAYRPDPLIPDTDDTLKSAREEAAKAKASWLLRNDITDGVMTVNPILKAVHGSKQASPIERDILPHLQTRDTNSAALSTASTAHREALDALTNTEAESLRAARHNADLATHLLTLTAEVERRKGIGLDDDDAGGDFALAAEAEALRARVKASRQKWKVMKGTVSAMVVGSGVDWARDGEMRRMVLDPEEDEVSY